MERESIIRWSKWTLYLLHSEVLKCEISGPSLETALIKFIQEFFPKKNIVYRIATSSKKITLFRQYHGNSDSKQKFAIFSYKLVNSNFK